MASASQLYFKQLPVGEMANYAYLIGCQETRKAVVVDPAWNVDGLLDLAEADGMDVEGALVTHYHQDHVGGSIFGMDIQGLDRLLERRPMPIHVQKVEAHGLKQVTGVGDADLALHEGGDVIELGAIQLRLLHTPGHTPGSQCFLVEEAGQPAHLVSGDTLFLNACGRVDLPGGDAEALYYSLNQTLKKLPDETLLFPGHAYGEPSSTMGEQKRTNPFLRVTSLETFLSFLGV
ncbi:MAG: MBL fold metallo-hydrolase [Actinomycetota bacterium]|nr:MBL fold metallo-hydrolase [Actinomycetota bacterium]